MKVLIDADLILYRAGFVTESEPEEMAIQVAEDIIDDILLTTNATEFVLYLSDSTENGFRKKLFDGYKANRVQPRPKHYDAIKNRLITNWNAEIAIGQEADDLLGINQSGDTAIASIDKDLLQIAGNHYNFVKKTFTYILPEEGLHWFYQQCLIGDTSDNIKGVTGIGKVKAVKLLGPPLEGSETLWFNQVREAFRNEYGDVEGDKAFLLAGRLLKIRQKEGEIWNFPKENV